MQNDIHVVALAQAQTEEERREAIRAHYQAQAATGAVGPKNRSALVRSQGMGQAAVHAVFGGQGNTKNYFGDLRTAYNTYRPLVEDFVEPLANALLELSLDSRARDEYPQGLDVLAWLRDEDATPAADYLNTAPVSFPLVGLLQLLQLTAVFVGLGCGPEDLPSLFQGLTAHSQGIVAAVAASEATNWSDFQDAALKAITILFWTGVRCQQVFSDTPLSDNEAMQLAEAGLGAASPMLAISGLPRNQVERAVSEINGFLPEDSRIVVSVVNSAGDLVVSGPRRTLAALVDALESVAGKEPAPLSGRSLRFLPVTIPCNSFLLAEAVPLVEQDLSGMTILAASLRIPINKNVDGVDLRTASHNLIPTMVRLIASEQVDWSRSDFTGVTHAVDFGPGCVDGAGALMHRESAGKGPRVLIASKLEMADSSELGAIVELFDHVESLLAEDETQPAEAMALDENSGLLIRSPPSTGTPARPLPAEPMTADELGALLSGGAPGWRKALFSSPTIIRHGAAVPNPILKLLCSAAADTVEIGENRISLHNNNDLVLYVSKSDDDEITVMPFTWVTASNNLISLAMKFKYDAETSAMREVTEDRDQRIYDMYRQLWLGDVADRSATEQGSPEVNVFEAAFAVEQDRVEAFNRAVGESSKAVARAVDDRVPMDFAMAAAWKPISQALLQDPVQGDLLSLVHLSNSYEAAPGAAPLEIGEALVARAYVAGIAIGDAGKTVEVACQILRCDAADNVALTVRSRFLFRGHHGDLSSSSSAVFSRTVDDRYEVRLATAGDQAVLLSRPWFRPTGFQDLDGATLEFRVHTLSRATDTETTGDAFLRSRDGALVHIAIISSHDPSTEANPVTSYLLRVGKPLGRVVGKDEAGVPAAAPVLGQVTTLSLVIPEPGISHDQSSSSSTSSSPASPSSALNPRHSSPMFAALVDLPAAMARRVYCSAAVRGLVEEHAGAWLVRRLDVGFTSDAAMTAGRELQVTLTTHATHRGAKRTVRASVASASSGEVVLTAQAVVENPAAVARKMCRGDGSTTAAAAAAAPAPPPRMSTNTRSPSFRRPRMPSFRRSTSGISSDRNRRDHHHHHHHNHGRVVLTKPFPGFGLGVAEDAAAAPTPTPLPAKSVRLRGSWDRWMGRVEPERAPGFAMSAPPSVIRV